jgi:acyl-CoA synthetase (AMP-forming)/AMP-acid ligase II
MGRTHRSVGVAQTPVQLRVADAQGRDLPTGEIGEVLVKGDSVMAGYWRNPEATAAAMRDGWLFTGDVGCLDADGFLTLKDRSKDLIISGGSNIYPREVEEVLLTLPGVAEVAVIGAPDPEWGEVVVAFVVPAAGAAITAEGARRALPGADRALQAAQALRLRRRAAEEQLRQGAEDRAARAALISRAASALR